MRKRLCFTREEWPSSLVSLADVAERAGVTLNAVQKWQIRYEDGDKAPPGPVAYPAVGTIYWWPDWLEWLEKYRPAAHAYALAWMEAAANGETEDLERSEG